jgi:phosphatidylserine/phosphatidylglycerophosphate/cardiolipin synthase-like enzyme
MTSPVEVRFLRDVQHGGAPGQLSAVADALAQFVSAATTSVDVAIYDFRLTDPAATSTVVDAFTGAAERGLTVRIGYDAGKPAAGTVTDFAALEADPAPAGTAEWLTSHFAGTAVQLTAIQTSGQLMHSKYVIRDALGAGPAVWTGSTNFTDDAWTRQENNIIVVADAPMARAYRTDFDQMWNAASISGTGADLGGSDPLSGPASGTVSWDFSPGDGPAINTALADRVAAATDRIVIGAMVLTSHDLLAALAAAIDRNISVTGIYDGGQMDPIVAQWQDNPADAAVLADWHKIAVRLAVKHSTPYTPDGPHDFMHLKVLIADDTVVTGSYNFSANAERNAENQIHLDDPATVSAYTDYLAAVTAAYPATADHHAIGDAGPQAPR